jgi:hypothetical protein
VADPKQPTLDQAGKRQQDADAGHRGPLAKQRRRIIEQPQMGELPIEAAIARVAVEAHRNRITIIRRGDRIDLAGAIIRHWRDAIRAIAARRGRRDARRRRLARRRDRDPGERKLPVVGELASSDQLADGLLAHSQPVRDGPVAHPLALEHLDAAQTFAGDPPATAAPTRRATEPRHPALRIAPLVPPYERANARATSVCWAKPDSAKNTIA